MHPWLSEPRLSEPLFIQTHKANFHEFYYNLQDGGHLCFNRLYVACFLHTNCIHASANATSTERV